MTTREVSHDETTRDASRFDPLASRFDPLASRFDPLASRFDPLASRSNSHFRTRAHIHSASGMLSIVDS